MISERTAVKPQSLSPFESRTTTWVVWWSLLLVSTAVLVVCWIYWI